jgi:molybdopterin molybdotransferase
MSLIAVEEALSRILDGAAPLGLEKVKLPAALGRVLAEDLGASRSQPPFAASAMDGYAVRGGDVASAPAALTVIGEVPAGAVFSGKVGPGEAARIFTGAPLPDGADTIIVQENTERKGDRVTVLEAARPGAHVRPAGLDFSEGDVLLKAGLRLQPRHLALAAAMNHAALPVRRRPRVGVLATGDELVPPGTEPGPGQIVSSNSAGIAALVSRAGGEPVDLGIARDEASALAESINAARAEGVDILVTLGGASVGDHDLVMRALEAEGLKLGFWRVAMRPGKPLMFGRLGEMRVLGLPGNPVSAIVCGLIFLKPLIAALLGLDAAEGGPATALSGADLPENDRRQDYLRAGLQRNERGQSVATPFGAQDSSMLALLAKADCLIVRPPHAAALKAGASVDILPLDDI